MREHIVIPDIEEAKKFPLSFPPESSNGIATGQEVCSECKSPLSEVVVTTFNKAKIENWHQHPLVFDGFKCPSCLTARAPRGLPADEVEVITKKAIEHAEKGELDEAEYCFRRLTNSWPQNFFTYINLGNLYCNMYLKATQSDQVDQTAVERAAKYMVEQYETGLRIHNELPAEQKDQAPIPSFVFRHLGLLLREFYSDFNKSNNYLRKYLELPTTTEQSDKDLINAFIAQNDAGLNIVKGMELLKPFFASEEKEKCTQENFAEGIRLLDGGVRVCDWRNDAKFVLGKAYQLQGESEKAYQLFKGVYESNPTNPDAANELAVEALALGKLDESMKAAKSAVDNRPEDPALEANYALTLLFAHQVDQALYWANKSLAKEPEDPVTKNVLSVIRRVKEKNLPIEQVMMEYMKSNSDEPDQPQEKK